MQHEYARRECTIHSQLKHENVVELYDYTESDKEFVLLMEYCNDANYFQDKLEEVSSASMDSKMSSIIEAFTNYESGEVAKFRARLTHWVGLHPRLWGDSFRYEDLECLGLETGSGGGGCGRVPHSKTLRFRSLSHYVSGVQREVTHGGAMWYWWIHSTRGWSKKFDSWPRNRYVGLRSYVV